MDELEEKTRKKTDRLEKNVTYYLTEYVLRVLIVQRLIILPLSRTKITPNQVTITGFCCAMLSCVFMFLGHNVIAGILFLTYSVLDHTDGMLARFKNLTSKLGKILDDTFDYIVFNTALLSIYLAFNTDVLAFVFAIIAMNIHWQVCPKYIVPNLRKLKNIRRWGLKKWLMDRGWILGIDVSLLALLIFFGLIFNIPNLLLYVIGFIYMADLVYRYVELRVNFFIAKELNELG